MILRAPSSLKTWWAIGLREHGQELNREVRRVRPGRLSRTFHLGFVASGAQSPKESDAPTVSGVLSKGRSR